MRKRRGLVYLVGNLPYLAMLLLGSAVLAAVLRWSAWAWVAAGAYLVCGVLGAFWIMVFLCPHCALWGSPACPSGYGLLASRIRARQSGRQFAEKFKRHIPVIVPLWIVPPLAGGWGVAYRFSWYLVGLVAVFVLSAFVILPLASVAHGCAECPNRNQCPWRRRKRHTAH